jgi:hypothetical protein
MLCNDEKRVGRKMILATFLGDVFTNSSGHPVPKKRPGKIISRRFPSYHDQGDQGSML